MCCTDRQRPSKRGTREGKRGKIRHVYLGTYVPTSRGGVVTALVYFLFLFSLKIETILAPASILSPPRGVRECNNSARNFGWVRKQKVYRLNLVPTQISDSEEKFLFTIRFFFDRTHRPVFRKRFPYGIVFGSSILTAGVDESLVAVLAKHRRSSPRKKKTVSPESDFLLSYSCVRITYENNAEGCEYYVLVFRTVSS